MHNAAPSPTASPLYAPFPYFGGKRAIADKVWAWLGDVPNYVEPFYGSGAVHLLRPGYDPARHIETLNDADGLVCVAPDTRILCGDLRWRCAGELTVGDAILGFDEHNGIPQNGIMRRADRPTFQPPQTMRRWRRGSITATRVIQRPAYRLRFDDGTTVISSEDHLWLAGKSTTGGRGARWVSTKRLRCDHSAFRSHVMKLCDVIDAENTMDAGWIGGFYDGEGHIQGRGAGWRVSVSQKLGPEADRAEKWLREHDFTVFCGVRARGNPQHQAIVSIQINGGMRETLRFLMLTRPERLIRDALGRIHERSIYGRERQVVGLIEKTPIGMTEVVALETDTHTYIAEGLASHNCNFWRAVAADPEQVAHYADWPVNENDLHARHAWLVGQKDTLQARLEGDPAYYDAQIAGWWVWGLCCWIGRGWCKGTGPWTVVDRQLIRTGNAGQGIQRQLIRLGDGGNGIHRPRIHLGDAGRGVRAWFVALQARLRRVRVACGPWQRVLGDSATAVNGLTGVFLDPPYSHALRDAALYRVEGDMAGAVQDWCQAHSANAVRIVLCGYGQEHDALLRAGWRKWQWCAPRGYGSQGVGRGAANRHQEACWISPHCLDPSLPDLFSWRAGRQCTPQEELHGS